MQVIWIILYNPISLFPRLCPPNVSGQNIYAQLQHLDINYAILFFLPQLYGMMIYFIAFHVMHTVMSPWKWIPLITKKLPTSRVCLMPVRICNYLICFIWHHSHHGVSMVVADGLAPIWCQVICNHHDDVGQWVSSAKWAQMTVTLKPLI